MKTPHSRSSVPTWILALALGGLFFWIMSPFLLPILMAGVVAATVEPSFKKLRRKTTKSYRGLWATGFIFILYVLIGLPLFYGVVRLVTEINEKLQPQDGQGSSITMQSLMSLKNSMDQKLSEILSSMGLEMPENFQNLTQQAIQKVLAFAGQASSQFLIELPGLLLSFLVFTAALFFLLTEGARLKAYLEHMDIFDKEDLDSLLRLAKRSCRSILISTFLIGGIQALIVSVASLFLVKDEFLLIFVITFVCSLIPIIGAAPVALVLALSAFFKETPGIGIAWIIISVIAGTIDNILKPFLIKTEEELHPLVTLLSILGGVALWGFTGLFAGPLIATLAIATVPKFVQRAKAIESGADNSQS